MDPSLGLSLAALVVSIWAVVAGRTTASKANALQERLLRLEQAKERDRLLAAKKAAIVAWVNTVGNSTKMYFRNEGEGVARAISVELDGRPIEEHPVALSNDPPPQTLSSRGEAHVLLAPHMGAPIRANVRITWEDDSGEPGLWVSDLKLV